MPPTSELGGGRQPVTLAVAGSSLSEWELQSNQATAPNGLKLAEAYSYSPSPERG